MSVDFQKVMRISVERNDIVQFILLFNVLNCSLSTQRYARRVCVQCVVRTVIMYFLYQGLHALVLVSEYGEYRIRFLVVVWSACLMVGPVGDLVSLHSGPLVCRSGSQAIHA